MTQYWWLIINFLFVISHLDDYGQAEEALAMEIVRNLLQSMQRRCEETLEVLFSTAKKPSENSHKNLWYFDPIFRLIKNCFFIILEHGSRMCMAIIQWNLSEWSKKCFLSNKWLFKMQLKPRPVSLIISPAHCKLLDFSNNYKIIRWLWLMLMTH